MTMPRRIEFVIEVGTGVAEIEADPLKFKQIIYNLLSNAVKFSPEASQVRVSVLSLTAADSPLRAESIRVAVADRGAGIDPSQHDLIFREFQQLPVQSGRPEGTGLGLALVKRFVELHGGVVGVESAPGRGSEFWFVLPKKVVSC
jgi:signal transduction histidine kinase